MVRLTRTLGLHDRLRANRRLAVEILVLVAAAAAIWQSAPAIRDTARATLDLSDEPVANRELAPAYALQLPPTVLTESARLIPRDASYTVVVGTSLPLPGALGEAVAPLLHTWLFPRRHTSLAAAEWVVAYGAPTETLGVELEREVEIEPGVVVAKVGR